MNNVLYRDILTLNCLNKIEFKNIITIPYKNDC